MAREIQIPPTKHFQVVAYINGESWQTPLFNTSELPVKLVASKALKEKLTKAKVV